MRMKPSNYSRTQHATSQKKKKKKKQRVKVLGKKKKIANEIPYEVTCVGRCEGAEVSGKERFSRSSIGKKCMSVCFESGENGKNAGGCREKTLFEGHGSKTLKPNSEMISFVRNPSFIPDGPEGSI